MATCVVLSNIGLTTNLISFFNGKWKGIEVNDNNGCCTNEGLIYKQKYT